LPASRRHAHRGLFTSLARDALGTFGIEPAAACDKIDQRRGYSCDHGQARRGGKIVPRQQRFANGRNFPEAGENAVDRECGHLRVAILRKHEAGLGGADLGKRRSDRALQAGAACDRDLHVFVSGSDRVDQIGIDEQRRERQHRSGDLRLIGRERQHDHGRRARARRQRVGKRPAHQR
jgi:hypothetical protein